MQEDFNKMFPFLKIEFIKGHLKPSDVLSKKSIWQNNMSLGECRNMHKDGFLTLTPETTVFKLAQNFHNDYGLSIQIFRHSGKAWLETSKTNYWTLDQQNKMGEELSKGN